MFSTQKLVIIVGVLAILAFFIYGFFVNDDRSIQEFNQANTEIVGEDILSLIDRLQKISIDKSLFSSVLFTNLMDLSVDLYPEAQGRPNPFAVIGVDSSISVSTTSRAR